MLCSENVMPLVETRVENTMNPTSTLTTREQTERVRLLSLLEEYLNFEYAARRIEGDMGVRKAK